jgi:hypothetical protein
MVKFLTIANSIISVAAMANALMLKNSRPEVSTTLMWFSLVTGSTALVSETIEVFEPHGPDWQPSLEPKAQERPLGKSSRYVTCGPWWIEPRPVLKAWL